MAVRKSVRSTKPVDRFTIAPPTTASVEDLATSNTGVHSRKRARSEESESAVASNRPYSYVQVTIQQSSRQISRRQTQDPPATTGAIDSDQDLLVLEADAVVCTLPLGILKLDPLTEQGVSFEPPLPLAKQRAIERLGTGLLNKCVLSFPHIFWQDSDFLGLAESAASSYLVLNAANYTGGKPILLFMYGGNFARDVENWTDQEIVDDCLIVLKKICGRRTLPPIVDYHVTRWGKEQYSRMAFTYVPPGVDGFADLKTLSQPIYDREGTTPILMFAGEHTTPYHPSTIHGAFLSGIREAYRLDCAVFPEALGNLRFSDEELYQRTFSIGAKILTLVMPSPISLTRTKKLAQVHHAVSVVRAL